jgi:hypothetical protein
MTKELEEIQHEFNQATHKENACEVFLESLDSETLAMGERRVKEVWE